MPRYTRGLGCLCVGRWVVSHSHIGFYVGLCGCSVGVCWFWVGCGAYWKCWVWVNALGLIGVFSG